MGLEGGGGGGDLVGGHPVVGQGVHDVLHHVVEAGAEAAARHDGCRHLPAPPRPLAAAACRTRDVWAGRPIIALPPLLGTMCLMY